jgi:hypothetical protein
VVEGCGKQMFLGNSNHGMVFSRAGYDLRERFFILCNS